MIELSDTQKAILWCHGALKGLCDLGLLSAGNLSITIKGISEYDQLDKTYSPQDEEIREFLICTRTAPVEMLFILLKKYRDDRESMIEWVEKR